MSDTESFFGDPDPIFADKELLRVSHLPEGDRIIGRDEELTNLANAIKDAQRGGTPNNVLIYGKTGTGKSLCRSTLRRISLRLPPRMMSTLTSHTSTVFRTQQKRRLSERSLNRSTIPT